MTVLLRPEQVAEILGVSTATLWDWRQRRLAGENLGPEFVKVGPKVIRYQQSDLDNYIKEMKNKQ